MLRSFLVAFLTIVGLTASPAAVAVGNGLVARWKFDEGRGKIALDSVTRKEDAIQRNFWHLPGVSGTGVKFDGFTTHIVRKAKDAPRLQGSFTI
ncbi:hypothetical protein ES703_51527 [subsurface metagenome]